MKRNALGLTLLAIAVLGGCATPYPRFEDMFTIPREPHTIISPGQRRTFEVPPGRKAVITDVYIENHGTGMSSLLILEQRLPGSFEVRYDFRTQSGGTTIINFTTGLKLGDEAPIANTIVIENPASSSAGILARVNGYLVDS